MNNDLELLMEQDKLQETIGILQGEILKYIAKRKYITEYIIEYRKKYIEEYRDDEDRVVEYFDHEIFVKEEAYKTIDKRLKEFTILKESPYFGKITFTEEDEGVQDLYIGRFGLTPEETYDPIVVDWRTPIASLFYKGSLGENSYKSPMGDLAANILARRQLIIKKAELKGIFDSAIDVKDEILQMVLTSNSGEKLKDIVMTIQQEQDEIIRAPKNKVIIVNGVAGSGKTTIALHRVSYMLYNDREQFGDKVLILGPNDIFMDYIAQVLPSLGEGGIFQDTFQNFAIDQIGLKEKVKSYSDYIEEAMKGNDQALKEYRYKSSDAFTRLLDDMIEDMNTSYFKINPIDLLGERVVEAEEIQELFTTNYGYMPLFRRSEKIKRILISKIRDKRDEIIRKLNAGMQQEIETLSKEDYEMAKSNMEYQRKVKIREIIRGVMDSRDELDKWINHEDTLTLYKRLTNTQALGYMDLAGILYLAVKLDGKKCKREIKHVVIDEAQDYNMTQFKVIMELTGCKSYTIVGDSNQRLIETEEEPAMLHLEELFPQNIESFNLKKSYRSTQQIMQYASKFLKEDSIIPLVRNGEPVLEEETTSTSDTIETLISIIEDYKEEGLENIAIITRDKEKLKEISHLLKAKDKNSYL